MPIIKDKMLVRCFFFTALLVANFNFMGQSMSFMYVQGYFGVTAQDAAWLLRGFQSGTIITGIAGLVFIKWMGNRNLFIGASITLLIATIFAYYAPTFPVLLVSRIIGGIANGFIIAVSGQVFLSTYEGKSRMLGSLYTVAATVSGICTGLLSNSLFTEDYSWRFNYVLGIPVLVMMIILAFFLVPARQENEEIEEDWISLFPFSALILSLFFVVLYRQQMTGMGDIKIITAAIIAMVSAAMLLIRGFVHKKPLFDTRLLQYPGFDMALILSFLGGAAFVFNVSLLAKLMGGILQMPLKDVFHFMNWLFFILYLIVIVTIILLAKKISAYWLMIAGLLSVAFTAYSLSGLNTEFSFPNIVIPSVIGIAGSGIIATAVIMIAVKSVPLQFVGKVANFRSVAFTMGIALTATDLGRILDLERVRNFNLMTAYTDPGNPLFQERLNGLTAFYQSNGYDASQAYDAALNGMTGMIQLQSFFLGTSEILRIGCAVCIILAIIILLLWVIRNYQLLINFFSFKNIPDEKGPGEK